MTYWLARLGEEKPGGPYSRADLSRMYQAGEADMYDQVCLAGTERWQDLGKLLALRDYQNPAAAASSQPREQVVLAKKKRRVMGSAGCVVFVFGLLLLVLMPPIGVLMIVAGLIIEQCSVKVICTNCGNVTVKTARECAVCRAHFVR